MAANLAVATASGKQTSLTNIEHHHIHARIRKSDTTSQTYEQIANMSYGGRMSMAGRGQSYNQRAPPPPQEDQFMTLVSAGLPVYTT